MASNRTLLYALGGAAAAALIYRYLNTEKGKELLNTASTSLKDFATKATDYAKENLGQLQNSGFQKPSYKNTNEPQPS
jgi:hypothetical protein